MTIKVSGSTTTTPIIRRRVTPDSPSLYFKGSLAFDPLAMQAQGIVPSLTLERLFSTESSAAMEMKTKDLDLVGKKSWGDKGEYIPESLRGLPEAEFIWNFIKNPTSNQTQILQRQVLLTSLTASENLEEINQVKNTIYSIGVGMNLLFAPVRINDEMKVPAIWAYRRYEKHELYEQIHSGISHICEGKDALERLIPMLSDLEPGLMRDIVSTLYDHALAIEHFSKDFFLKEDFDDYEIQKLGNSLTDDTEKIGAFISFAKLAKEDGYTVAGFDPTVPSSYESGWMFAKKREGQVINDSAADHPVTIYSGAQESGKSYKLKSDFLIQLLAQSWGLVPCKNGNFVLHDALFFVDRASTSPYHDLSAYGEDMNGWVDIFAQVDKDKCRRPVYYVDEGLSTASDDDQYKIMRAKSMVISEKGGRIFITTHNERLIEVSEGDPGVGVYHFKTEVDKEKNDIDFQRKMRPGPDDSKALAVARLRGVPEELIRYAEQYLRGEFEAIVGPGKVTWTKPDRFSDEEREAMKKEGRDPFTAFREEDRFFRLFSEDPNFQTRAYSASDIVTGEDSGYESGIRFGGWEVETAKDRGNCILSLLTEAPCLTPHELLERQKMFEKLSGNDQFDKVRDLSEKIIWQTKFLGMITYRLKDLLNFNKVMNPFKEYGDAMVRYPKVVCAYLSLQSKILGDDPVLDRLIEDVRRVVDLSDRIDHFHKNQDVNEVQRIIDEIAEGEVDSDVFLALAKDEPNPEKWEGRFPRKRVRAYLKWIQTHDFDYYWDVDDKLGKLIGNVRMPDDFSAKEIRKSFFEMNQDEPNKEKWGDTLCVQRIEDYKEYVEHLKGHENELKRRRLEDIIADISHEQRFQVIHNRDLEDEFWSLVEKYGVRDEFDQFDKNTFFAFEKGLMDEVKEGNKRLPPKALFEIDPQSIKEEVAIIVSFFKEKHRGGDYGYDHKWPNNLVVCLLLEMMIDPRNYFQELIDLLKSYDDSVYLHQLANGLDSLSKRPFKREAKFKEAKDVFGYLKRAYNRNFKSKLAEYYAIEREYTEFLRRFNIGEYLFKIGYAQFVIDNIDEEHDLQVLEKVCYNFQHFSSSRTSYNPSHGVDSPEEERRLIKNFIDQKIRGSEVLAEMRELPGVLSSVVERAKKYMRKHKIRLSPQDWERLNKGDLLPLGDDVRADFQSEKHKDVETIHHAERPVMRELDLITSIALLGRMINEQGYCKVDFNSDGRFEVEDSFSIVKPKKEQVANTFSFEEFERIRILCGPNMSGKTFGGKGLSFGVPAAHSIGYFPGERATMPFMGRSVFFDRIVTKKDEERSSFTTEMDYLVELCGLLDKGVPVFGAIDELGSTTSNSYRNAISYGFLKYAADRGHYFVFISHGHEMIQVESSTNPQFVIPYNFATHKDDKGEIQFDYRLTRGHALSMGIPVARKLGYPKEILDIAESLD
ncbi:MAG: hypothetical protein HQ564_05420 [Candidatus Saganbacteria bacterium]|nr:hypothetical protein [Candidatus Saganbacteria bacterium]